MFSALKESSASTRKRLNMESQVPPLIDLETRDVVESEAKENGLAEWKEDMRVSANQLLRDAQRVLSLPLPEPIARPEVENPEEKAGSDEGGVGGT